MYCLAKHCMMLYDELTIDKSHLSIVQNQTVEKSSLLNSNNYTNDNSVRTSVSPNISGECTKIATTRGYNNRTLSNPENRYVIFYYYYRIFLN